ncbi:RDD family protein [Marinobacterium arenosum]|uniref:RDD family protein n=1 Tax=Marinobacterium arenosum TaxID=2862496 RepID=UPI001C98A32E|nr:RDD family protein [Marinobacterium arenosum]MBY4678986.1 RDD family protein [Marinobacterium arenosum]
MARAFPERFDQVSQASPVKRLAALLYDSMLTVALWMVIGAIAVALNQGEAVGGPLFQSVLFILTYLFFAYFWNRSGQTLGLLAWRLRVQSVEGEHLTYSKALVRFLAAGLSLGCFGLGYLWMFVDRNRLSWHDRLSGSCVVQLPKADKKAAKR